MRKAMFASIAAGTLIAVGLAAPASAVEDGKTEHPSKYEMTIID